ncbi:MAG TPA: HNH endonuclease [Metalysinibacillus sp.]
MCRECKRYGKTTTADTVHHVQPYETHAQLKLSSDNLISLCRACHNAMHVRGTHELTDKGKQWLERKIQ